MQIRSLDHLVLTVASIDRTVAFYTTALGMEVELFGPERRTALKFGQQKINLHEAGREFEPKAARPTPGSGDLCFVVSDLEATVARLSRANVTIIEGPVPRTGARGPIQSVYVRDPDDNLIELSAYMAGSASETAVDGVDTAFAPDRLLQPQEMARVDARAIALGVPGRDLMEAAGQAVATAARRLASSGSRVLVLCGPGNNGGDGYVAARSLAIEGYVVRVAQLGDRSALRGDAAWASGTWAGDVEALRPDLDLACDVIVDALFGGGLSRPIDGKVAELVARINAGEIPVVSVDLPSGVSGETGAVLGVAIRATRTVTFVTRRPGHVLWPGRMLCGSVEVAPIGMPAEALKAAPADCTRNRPAGWIEALALSTLAEHRAHHKYERGHTLVMSGPAGRTGAARLSARGALRVGAGLVTVIAPSEAMAEHAARLDAIMLEPLGPGGLADALADARRNALVIGPGAGLTPATKTAVRAGLVSDAAVVLDADALTVFADEAEALFAAIRARTAPTVLTPHQGEFARLFGPVLAERDDTIEASKIELARAAAQASGAVVVLKGPDTVVAAPSRQVSVNDNAPAWLATAGSGDVLAGMIAGFLGQGLEHFTAASVAVWCHGAAAQAVGPGLIAEDLPEAIPGVFATLRNQSLFSSRWI